MCDAGGGGLSRRAERNEVNEANSTNEFIEENESKLMRCRYCSQILTADDPAAWGCLRCTRLKPLQFVMKQGDGVTGFREIMIAQKSNEPNRKLLETRAWHFTVFVDESGGVLGFELTDAVETRLLKWRRDGHPQFYRVENVGKGYGNRDEVRFGGTFCATGVVTELMTAGGNIRPEIRAILLKGIGLDESET